MRIKRALLSVSDKTGIVKLAQFLHDIGYRELPEALQGGTAET